MDVAGVAGIEPKLDAVRKRSRLRRRRDDRSFFPFHPELETDPARVPGRADFGPTFAAFQAFEIRQGGRLGQVQERPAALGMSSRRGQAKAGRNQKACGKRFGAVGMSGTILYSSELSIIGFLPMNGGRKIAPKSALIPRTMNKAPTGRRT